MSTSENDFIYLIAQEINMLSTIRVGSVFIKTFHYYFLSFFRKNSVRDLKQKWATSILNDFGYKISVSGQAPTAGPLILVGNHISYLDIILLLSAHPDIVFIAKKEVSKWPIIGVAAARVGTIFIDRNAKHDRNHNRKQIAVALKQNNSQVVVFPSGTTALDENKPWKNGIFEIAKENLIPVQVFKINYTPLRESAYIDEDNLLSQMKQIFKIKNKKATLQWLDQHMVDSPVETAKAIQQTVQTENSGL